MTTVDIPHAYERDCMCGECLSIDEDTAEALDRVLPDDYILVDAAHLIRLGRLAERTRLRPYVEAHCPCDLCAIVAGDASLVDHVAP